jgi:hypothetical protein
VVREQTAWAVPGNSHTARQGAAELRYAELTGDRSRCDNAVRQLNWATYMVDVDGKNCYPTDAVWLTDGYGDYLRHYLRAMAAAPSLAPKAQDHVLRSSAPLRTIRYSDTPSHQLLAYLCSSSSGEELIRARTRPDTILLEGKPLAEQRGATREGYRWLPMDEGGLLIIRRLAGCKVELR